jgi:hypothetical protein
MPFSDDRDSSFELLQEKMAEALAPFAAQVAARECAHGDWLECEDPDCKLADTRPKSGSMPVVQDFIVVMVIADMASEEQEIHAVSRPGQRNHITKGLLHVALNE